MANLLIVNTFYNCKKKVKISLARKKMNIIIKKIFIYIYKRKRIIKKEEEFYLNNRK